MEVQPPAVPAERKPKTLLIVDDDPVVLGLMTLALGSLEFELIPIPNGEKALEWLESHPERPIDLLITDILMPRIGGNELASRLELIRPGMRVLYCSGHPRERVLPRSASPGERPIHFIQKPFSVEAFLNSVRAALE